jgi:hypothetical protein
LVGNLGASRAEGVDAYNNAKKMVEYYSYAGPGTNLQLTPQGEAEKAYWNDMFNRLNSVGANQYRTLRQLLQNG